MQQTYHDLTLAQAAFFSGYDLLRGGSTGRILDIIITILGSIETLPMCAQPLHPVTRHRPMLWHQPGDGGLCLLARQRPQAVRIGKSGRDTVLEFGQIGVIFVARAMTKPRGNDPSSQQSARASA